MTKVVPCWQSAIIIFHLPQNLHTIEGVTCLGKCSEISDELFEIGPTGIVTCPVVRDMVTVVREEIMGIDWPSEVLCDLLFLNSFEVLINSGEHKFEFASELMVSI